MTLTRRKAAAGAVVLVAGLLVVTAGSAEAETTVIKVTEITTGFKDTIGEDLPVAGDSYSFTSKLLQSGDKVGTDKGTCVLKKILGPADSPTGAKTRCKVTLKFAKKGTIKAAGTFKQTFGEPVRITLPITGGTGRYADASGTLKVRQINDVKSKLTLTVTRP